MNLFKYAFLLLAISLSNSGHSSAYALIDLNPVHYNITQSEVNEFTDEDLRAYAGAALREDERLDGIRFEKDKVEVRYKEEGKFLALVPITFTVRVLAKASGEVELNYPWYAFLTVDREEMLKTELKVAVDTVRRARTVGSVRADGEVENPLFTASESAEVAAKMHAILKSGLSGEASK